MGENHKVNCVVFPTNAIVQESKVNIMQCINLFESGAENIYLIGDDGKYRWRAAQRGKSHLRKSARNNWEIEFFPLPPIVTDLAVKWDSQVAIKKLAYNLFAEYAGITEFPIVDSQGRVKGVVRSITSSVDTEPVSVNWSLLEDKQISNASNLFSEKKIYISSLENVWLKNAFEHFHEKISIEVLSEDNLEKVLSGKSDGLLLYVADIFPVCPKMSAEELYEKIKYDYELQYHEELNIVISVSASIVKYVAVPLYIMSKNLSDKHINLYMLHDGISAKELSRLYDDCAHYKNINLMDILVSEEDQKISKKLMEYVGRPIWPANVFYGMISWKYLPSYLDRVLFLDAADLMVMDNIDEFYFQDFDGMEIMATVVQFKNVDNKYVMYDVDDLKNEKYRLCIMSERFNSGVHMMNLDKMRKTGWDMPSLLKIAQIIAPESTGIDKDYYTANQTLLSVAYLGRTKAFGVKGDEVTEFDRAYTPYNLCIYYFRKDNPIINKPLWYEPKIIHFAGALKPWQFKWNVNPIDEFTDDKPIVKDIKDYPQKRYHIFHYIWHNYAYELQQKRKEWNRNRN